MPTMHTSPPDSLAAVDDATALRRYVRTGDPEAFELLARRYYAMVVATCRRRLGSDADAEDAAQETFLRLARSAGRVRSNVAAWLHACAIGTSIDLVRRAGARSRAERTAADRRDHALEPPASERLWIDLEPVIDQALAELGDEDRQLVVARFLAGRSQAELARELGVSEGTVSRRVSRVLEKLRRRLARGGLSVVGVVALGAALRHASDAASAGTASSGVAKIAIAGIGVQKSKLPAVLVSAGLAASIGAAATVATVLAVGPGSGAAGGTPAAPPMPALVLGAGVSARDAGPPPPARTLGPFEIISAYDEDFDASGTFVTGRSLALRRGVDAATGVPVRIRLDIRETRVVEDDRRTKSLREVAELDAITASVMPREDEWQRFERGEALTLRVAFDQYDRIVIREKDDKVQMGKNEPAWYGVRPPLGWDERDDIPDDAGPLGILGPWTESERIPVTMSGTEIRFGPDGWNAGRYRIIEWIQMSGYSRVLSIQAGGRDPRLIGTRFRLLIRKKGDDYEIAYFTPSSGRSTRWPASFEYTAENPVRVVTIAGDR
ncbi:MAG: sigma-70 family RNA polymerase sigma factor [Planctomycetota bacterium]